jgi:glycosyltransferase involved in cell wall biosynthesis
LGPGKATQERPVRKAIKATCRPLADFALSVIFLPVLFVTALCVRTHRAPGRRTRPRLVFGPTPIINNKYWSRSLTRAGFDSRTLMRTFYVINKREDFDLYFDDFGLTRIPFLDAAIRKYLVSLYVMVKFDIAHLSYDGGFLGQSFPGRLEIRLLHLAGLKVMMIPYGSDFYRYSQVVDPSWRHALLTNYPGQARKERSIRRNVEFLNKKADFVVTGLMLDGSGRWDMLPFSIITVDENLWTQRKEMSGTDGRNGVVRIVHTPNHKGVKGTEFLTKAIEELREEGYQIDLRLLQNVPNDEVRQILNDWADILVEQLIAPGYAVSAMEGMATGLPVLSNLTDDQFVRLFKRYSYLSECPIVPTNPETVKENLRFLIEHPEARKELGAKGRQYVEKYHSSVTTQIVFSKIYEKIWYGKDIELQNYFHPLIGHYDSDYEKAIAGRV